MRPLTASPRCAARCGAHLTGSCLPEFFKSHAIVLQPPSSFDLMVCTLTCLAVSTRSQEHQEAAYCPVPAVLHAAVFFFMLLGPACSNTCTVTGAPGGHTLPRFTDCITVPFLISLDLAITLSIQERQEATHCPGAYPPGYQPGHTITQPPLKPHSHHPPSRPQVAGSTSLAPKAAPTRQGQDHGQGLVLELKDVVLRYPACPPSAPPALQGISLGVSWYTNAL
jgi:hypothetical protein